MRSNKLLIIFLFLIFPVTSVFAQVPEFETAQSKLGRIWGGVTANGSSATFDFRAGFFPSDYNILQYRGQNNDNFFGSGFTLAATNWKSPIRDSVFTVFLSRSTNEEFLPNGKVVSPLTNYIRYKYPEQIVNNNRVPLADFGVHDPSKFTGGTYDQVLESTYKNVIGVEVKRKIMLWSQNFNDNYLIIDVEMTNVGVDIKTPDGRDSIIVDTLRNFHFMMHQAMNNNYYSNGSNPAPPVSERPKYNYAWQHYYGARPGDSMRVFYFYSADDPSVAGDDMGAPAISQNGRLLNTNYTFYTILHASSQPYLDPSLDVDDPLQPRVTYIGNDTRIPNPSPGEDPYGSRNFWAMRGGYSQAYPRSGTTHPGTFHGLNNDELGNPNFSAFVAGTLQNANSRNFSSFGPYQFPPNHKLRFVYAVGIAGIGAAAAMEIGKKWLEGTLENPPNMPDAETGWLPSNFAFPSGATEQDKRKARWISMGKDSMMLTAWRAKWNFENGYNIPQAPPPVSYLNVLGSGEGVEITWRNSEAEAMPNFAGYRIMRKVSSADTVFYQEIYNSDETDKADEHYYVDKSILYGAQYYYYIQTKALIAADDLTADPTTRGQIIYSNRNLIPNVTFINPPRFSSDDMSRIRVVPNPYNINDPLLKTYGFTDERGLIFFNIPGTVTIRIYTENGDLVQTIEHDSPQKAGSYTWDMITNNQQVINSGIYIAVFQKPNGEISYQKFVVVR